MKIKKGRKRGNANLASRQAEGLEWATSTCSVAYPALYNRTLRLYRPGYGKYRSPLFPHGPMHAGWPAHRCPVCAKFRQAMLGFGCIARFPPSLQAAESGHSPAPTNPLTAIPGGPAGSKAEVWIQDVHHAPFLSGVLAASRQRYWGDEPHRPGGLYE